MASRASSEIPASAPPVQIPALPGLGTSWYERGARYWLRRVGTAIFILVVMAMICFLAISLYQGFRDELPPTVRTVWDWAQVIASCVAVVWGWVVQRRSYREDLLDPPTPTQARNRKRAEIRRSPRLAIAGRGLLALAAPIMPAYAAWCVGWFVAMLTVREYPSEVGARRWLQKESTTAT
jgi:hypothetical protein